MSSNTLIPFDFDGSAVRVLMRGGAPWFVAKDVCDILELGNSRDAVSRLDNDERDGVGITDAIGREQSTTCISESGLYSLIFTSRKAEAKRFRKWVTAEVLPCIRQTGRYVRPVVGMETMPFRYRTIRPAVRAQLLNTAVQAVKMQGAQAADIPSVFLDFCELVAPAEGTAVPVDAPKIAQQSMKQTQLVKDFLKERMKILDVEEGQRLPSYCRTQLKIIHKLFTLWCGEHGHSGPLMSSRSLSFVLQQVPGVMRMPPTNVTYYNIIEKRN